jgi:isopenicillin N synthase-like dioxygenase
LKVLSKKVTAAVSGFSFLSLLPSTVVRQITGFHSFWNINRSLLHVKKSKLYIYEYLLITMLHSTSLQKEKIKMNPVEFPEDETMTFNVPTIDLANLPQDEVISQISRACAKYGFFQITNHSISHELIDEYLEQCRLYFSLPVEVKQQWKRNSGNARGWFNDELTKRKLDWKECLDFGVPGTRNWSVEDENPKNKCLDGWNQLPSEDILPDFRSTITRYFDECSKLADRIAVLMAKGLGQDENSSIIRELRENHSSYLRSNYYPVCNEFSDDGSKPLGISPHRDAGFLTVLLQDADCHSLQVLKGDSTWVTIHPERYAFTINTGDMAEVWSNGRYKAPLHRVLSNETKVRYSTPYFYNPSYETVVEPLVADGEKAIYSGVLWGYFRAVRFAGDLTGTCRTNKHDYQILNRTRTTYPPPPSFGRRPWSRDPSIRLSL